MQAIAARSNMKQHLDDAGSALKESERINFQLEGKLDDMKKEVERYRSKHDEMFNSVSSLNKRIEELESHKLHLLEKLKGQGDKAGLDYIVKTQGLENVRGKELSERVQVEDYNPESKRSTHRSKEDGDK